MAYHLVLLVFAVATVLSLWMLWCACSEIRRRLREWEALAGPTAEDAGAPRGAGPSFELTPLEVEAAFSEFLRRRP